jgi:hypothetical protein
MPPATLPSQYPGFIGGYDLRFQRVHRTGLARANSDHAIRSQIFEKLVRSSSTDTKGFAKSAITGAQDNMKYPGRAQAAYLAMREGDSAQCAHERFWPQRQGVPLCPAPESAQLPCAQAAQLEPGRPAPSQQPAPDQGLADPHGPAFRSAALFLAALILECRCRSARFGADRITAEGSGTSLMKMVSWAGPPLAGPVRGSRPAVPNPPHLFPYVQCLFDPRLRNGRHAIEHGDRTDQRGVGGAQTSRVI